MVVRVQDPIERQIYESRERANLEKNSQISSAEERGELKHAKKVVLKMIEAGHSYEYIADMNDLTIDEVKSLLN